MAAIVCTLRLPEFAGSTLDSYIRWHVHIGFEHLFLFVDDPTRDVVSLAIGDAWPRELVTVIRRDAKLKERQEVECTLWGDLGRFYEDEVQARQSLNAELAVSMARARNLRWLLHIDVDELFYTSAPSIHAHFARLDSLGVSQMTYANHEAVPERSDIGDYFRGATLFRRHHFEVSSLVEREGEMLQCTPPHARSRVRRRTAATHAATHAAATTTAAVSTHREQVASSTPSSGRLQIQRRSEITTSFNHLWVQRNGYINISSLCWAQQ